MIHDIAGKRMGPFLVLPEGENVEFLQSGWSAGGTGLVHRTPLYKQTSCEYCARIFMEEDVLCEGCGAPRRLTSKPQGTIRCSTS